MTVEGSAYDDAAGELLAGPPEPAAYRALLAEPGFRRLFAAMAASSLGDWIGLFAILALTESILGGGTRAAAFGLSGVMVARLLPTLMFGPVAGVYADRWDRKRTLIATDIGRGLVMAAIPFVGDYFQLFVATLCVELLSMLFAPAKDATLPNLVPRQRLVQANQLSLIVTYGTLPLGGALVAVFAGIATTFLSGLPVLSDRPVALAIWFNAATFFFSALIVAGIDIPRDGRRPALRTVAPSPWVELREGFAFIASHPMVRALVVGVMGAFLAAGVVVAVGKLFATVVNAGESGFGVLVAAVGGGLMAGLLLAGPLSRRLDTERLFAPGVAVGGGGLVVTALMPRLDLAVIPCAIMGIGAGVAFVTGYTMLQQRADDTIRGRTFASFNTGVRAALFTSTVIAPLLAGLIGIERPGADGIYGYQLGGVRVTLVVGGAIAILGAVWSGSQIHRVLAGTADIGLRARRRPHTTGLFIVFEGGEGAGKTTHIERLAAALRERGVEVITTREPGGTALGEQLRSALLDGGAVDPRAEALLYAAARAQHVAEVIRPALARGAVVLCDRYVGSSVVYQGVARGLGAQDIAQLNEWATEGLEPDLVILLDVDAERGLERAGGTDRLEAEGVEFHRIVNDAFRRQAAATPGRWVVIDARGPFEEVHRRVRAVVEEALAATETADG